MAAQWALTLAAAIGLAVNVAVQVAWYRLVRPAALLRSVVVGFGAGLISTIALTLVCVPWSHGVPAVVGQLAANALTSTALGYGYFHFVNLSETARRVRLLREFAEAGRGLTMEEVLKRYNAAEIMERRFGRLLRTGQVAERQGRYFIARTTVIRMAWLIERLKILVLGRGAEFDNTGKG